MNKTNIAKSSSLPNIIAKLNTHFDLSDKLEKLPFGPIVSPNPGPTFEIEVAAADTDVIKSNPVAESNAETIKKIKIYK